MCCFWIDLKENVKLALTGDCMDSLLVKCTLIKCDFLVFTKWYTDAATASQADLITDFLQSL